MGGRNASYLTMADTTTNAVVRQIGPLLSGTVRHSRSTARRRSRSPPRPVPRLPGERHHYRQGALHRAIQGNFPYTPASRVHVTQPRHLTIADEKQLW